MRVLKGVCVSSRLVWSAFRERSARVYGSGVGELRFEDAVGVSGRESDA